MTDSYQSPFSTRYSSEKMRAIFSEDFRISTYRKLWVALAKGQKTLGLNISQSQIDQMEKHIHTIDYNSLNEFEKKFKHETMANIYAFGKDAPLAKPIIHLGATSCFVTDNTDLIQIQLALKLFFQKLIILIETLSHLSKKYQDLPCVGYTHLQAAQPTTVGKRLSLYLQEFFFDQAQIKLCIEKLPFLGVKGATGTQASFLFLFDQDENKVKKLDEMIGKEMGFNNLLPLSSQTYSRKWDFFIVSSLTSFATSAHKMGTDLRLLSHLKEIYEDFGKTQVGSSAMPYKKNPIFSERVCGLSRFLISLLQNAAYTHSTQWLERTLDDSSNRRIYLPEAFLCADAIIDLLIHITKNLQVDTKAISKNLEENLPLFITENLLMQSVKKGADRQKIHEKLDRLSLEIQDQPDWKAHLFKALLKDSEFQLSKEDIEHAITPSFLIGRAKNQVEEYLKKTIAPFLKEQSKSTIYTPIEK